MKLVLEWKPSAVVIDINLQGESGLNLVRRLQDRTDIGLLILTGRGDPLDRVLGLELGADDYIVKPVLLRELLARINSVVRRVERSAA
ncbi:response regulator, partial [Acinetobacter baumannii]